MTEYIKGTLEDKEEIIDFINYVFSQNSRPHDFKKLVPKAYADHTQSLGAEHYLVKENGKIKGLVANRIVELNVCGKILKAGLIGNVSVHPYSRGAGYMRKLLDQAIEEARALGVALMVLSGQRQRYGYFGFENAGQVFRFIVSKSNIKHCFSDLDVSAIRFEELERENSAQIEFAHTLYSSKIYHTLRAKEEFFDIVHNWECGCRIVYEGEKPIGYIMGGFGELLLTDEGYLPKVLKAAFEKEGHGQIELAVPPCEKERIAFLSGICENYTLAHFEMVNVLNWQNTLETLLYLKSKTVLLQDGELCLRIGEKTYRIQVKDGKPVVAETTDKAELIFSHNQAERAIFGLETLIYPQAEFKNWLPLSFFVHLGDTF